MVENAAETLSRDLMLEFADLTGLSPDGSAPRRYLWTDSFAVCNFLELYRQTGKEKWRDLALRLVGQVHDSLGRHREDDPRQGWISGLSEEEGRRRPTAGGLRIGKNLSERRAEEAFDERREWDRDGQYYHYLTKWMHALNRVSRVTGDPAPNNWAIELAKTAHARFTYMPPAGGRKRMYWKMSIDLERPLVPSMGQHDPLDGLVTCKQLEATAIPHLERSPPDLDAEIAELIDICYGQNLATDDPLGTGGLLFDVCRMVQLKMMGAWGETDDLLPGVLDAALRGLEAFSVRSPVRLPAEYRLAFRELGLAIGLKAIGKVREWKEENPDLFGRSLRQRIEAFDRYAPLVDRIETFWTDGANRQTANWLEHREINMVMLATSLAPDGFLSI